ncbi:MULTISPECIES: hypothetical protein [unclassified Micromonospora]
MPGCRPAGRITGRGGPGPGRRRTQLEVPAQVDAMIDLHLELTG